MTLCEALELLRHPEGPPQPGTPRQDAVEVVWRTLVELASNKCVPGADRRLPDIWQQAVDRLTERFLRGAVRISASVKFNDEQNARAYLSRCLKNAVSDERRRPQNRNRYPGKVIEGEDEDDGEGSRQWKAVAPDPAPSAEACAEARQTRDEVMRLRKLLLDDIAPAAVRGARAREQILRDLRDLEDIRDGESTVDMLVTREVGPGAGEEDRNRCRDRIYQRFSRAVSRLTREVQRRLEDGRLSQEEHDLLRRLIDSLRIRESKR